MKHKITKFLDTTYFIFSGIYALPRIRYCCKAWVTSVIDDLNYNEVPHISCGVDAKVNSVNFIRNVNGTNKPNSNLHSEIFSLRTFDVYV